MFQKLYDKTLSWFERLYAAKSGGLGAEVDEVVRWYVKQLLLLNS